MTGKALTAANNLAQHGLECDVLHFPTVKPLDETALVSLAEKAQLVITIEEGTVIGGFGSAVLDCLAQQMNGRIPMVKRLGVPDAFLHDYGNQDWLMEVCGLQADQIVKTVSEAFSTTVGA